MKQKLELINQAHAIIYNNKEYKSEFNILLPFKVSDQYITFQQCLITLQDWPFEKQDSTFYSLVDIITELRDCDMYNQSVTKNVLSKRIKNNINEYSAGTNIYLISVIEILKKVSKNSCLVGGAVRDMCNLYNENVVIKDFDFVTDASYEHLAVAFQNAGFRIDETGQQFLVLRVSADDESYEIACYRKDNTYSDGRRPDSVDIGNIFTDSERRDFTVNSLYYDLTREVILDPTGMGIDDSVNKVLRFNGNPDKRIKEDKLRVFRAYRFISKGYNAEPRTMNAIRSNFEVALRNTDHNRIREEIEKMARV